MSAIVSLAEIAPAQSSFVYDGSQAHAVALTPEVEDMLRANCVVAIGVSGGKDSVACALAFWKSSGTTSPNRYLRTGPKLDGKSYCVEPTCRKTGLSVTTSRRVAQRRLRT